MPSVRKWRCFASARNCGIVFLLADPSGRPIGCAPSSGAYPSRWSNWVRLPSAGSPRARASAMSSGSFLYAALFLGDGIRFCLTVHNKTT